MFHSTLRNVGGSVTCSIPKPILEALGLQPNSRRRNHRRRWQADFRAAGKPPYRLDDLIKQGETGGAMTAEETDWLDDGPAGREAI